MLGMIILFIVFAGIGNFFQDRGQKTAGNIFKILFVFLTYYAVVFFNRKVNQLSPDCYGFHFRYFGRNVLVGIDPWNSTCHYVVTVKTEANFRQSKLVCNKNYYC